MKKNIKYDLIFVTKPVQYINARNAVQSTKRNSNKKLLIILDHFFNAEKFFLKIQEHDQLWNRVIFSASRLKALLSTLNLSVDTIFTNSDISKDAFIFKLFHPTSELILYEEGWGNYICDALFDRKLSKKALYDLLFLNRQYGASKFTSKIYLHYPQLCMDNIRNKVFKFENDLFTYLRKESDLFCKIFNNSIYKFEPNEKVAFILASKRWSTKFEGIDYTSFDRVYVKPHPHTLDFNTNFVEMNDFKMLGNDIFVELLIAKNDLDATVYHDNSMVGVYAKSDYVKVFNVNSDELPILTEFFSKFDELI
jgi:hypothetical protein